MAALSRRAVLGTVGVVTGLPAPAVADMLSPGMISDRRRGAWTVLIASVVKLHPNAPAALCRALDHGVDPRTFSGVALTGPQEDHLPALFFGDRQASYTMVLPGEVHEIRRFH